MVGGGGEKTFFGPVHRRSIAGLEDFELVAGALHEDPAVAKDFGERWGLRHVFTSYQEMVTAGTQNDLFDYVLIVTPNFMHYAPALLCLKAGIPVFCEKPLCMTLAEARELNGLATERRIPFGVNYTYNGHWSTKVARAFVRSGVLGDIRRAIAAYLQVWQWIDLGIQQEHRQDPAKSGDFNCNGDIGSHGHFAVRNITGLEVTEVCCVPRIHVAGRKLDDDVDTIIKLSNGGGGLCYASQIACGHQNDHTMAAYGSLGSVRWRQEDPQHLTVAFADGPDIVYTRGGGLGLDLINNNAMQAFCGAEKVADLIRWLEACKRFLHLPGGHGEDFYEAVGNNHSEFGHCVAAWQAGGRQAVPEGYDFPTVLDGLRGMQFLAACKANRDGDKKFTAVDLAV
jgi:predicted dehydrogenase